MEALGSTTLLNTMKSIEIGALSLVMQVCCGISTTNSRRSTSWLVWMGAGNKPHGAPDRQVVAHIQEGIRFESREIYGFRSDSTELLRTADFHDVISGITARPAGMCNVEWHDANRFKIPAAPCQGVQTSSSPLLARNLQHRQAKP